MLREPRVKGVIQVLHTEESTNQRQSLSDGNLVRKSHGCIKILTAMPLGAPPGLWSVGGMEGILMVGDFYDCLWMTTRSFLTYQYPSEWARRSQTLNNNNVHYNINHGRDKRGHCYFLLFFFYFFLSFFFKIDGLQANIHVIPNAPMQHLS